MNKLPPMPSPPTPGRATRGQSCLVIFLAFLLAAICFVLATLLSMGFAAVATGVVAAVFGVIGLHYLAWGWWLPGYLDLRDEDES